MLRGKKFDIANMNVIHFGSSKKNINLCEKNVSLMTKYKWDGNVSVTGNNFSATLISEY